MKMEKFARTKKILTGLAFVTIPVIGLVVTNHYMPEVTGPIFSAAKLQASEVGIAAVTYGGVIFLSKFAAAIGGDWFRSRNAKVQARHDEAMRAEALTQSLLVESNAKKDIIIANQNY